jgi:hypothetical protein
MAHNSPIPANMLRVIEPFRTGQHSPVMGIIPINYPPNFINPAKEGSEGLEPSTFAFEAQTSIH